MSAFTYVAKRKLEPSGFSKSGTDISAAHSDNSFNATTTNLSGLLTGQWVLVAGFANAGNNGWFQASGNSTSTKISQSTSSSLVTEAAGPSVTLVGYKRGLGQTYSLEPKLEQVNNSTDAHRSLQQPIGGGSPETLLYRIEDRVQVLTEIFSEAQMGQYREMLASVAAGETLTFDRYGTIASPVDPRQAMLDTEKWTEQRVGATMQYRLAFGLLLLS